MPSIKLPAFLLCALASGVPGALAATCQPISNRPYYVEKFTNYSPVTRPGKMNGNPNTSASGWPAGQFLLENYLQGRADAVMGAVPQREGTSFLFGGIYQGVALQQGLGVPYCIRVYAGDRYNTKSNGLSKMDIVTYAAHSELTKKVNASRGALYLLGRIPNMRAPYRHNTRSARVKQRRAFAMPQY